MNLPAGVGIGYRPRLAAALLKEPTRVDFVEIVAEALNDGRKRREAAGLAEVWPVHLHGVKLSLGSAEGIDDDRARSIGALARELRSPVVSEHVAFVRAGGREIGHLTELPMTRESVKIVARNVTRLRRRLPDVPLLLENVARAFIWPAGSDEMSEGVFHAEVAEATGCDLLLDVANLYANASNSGRDWLVALAEYPLERVGMVHVAGGRLENGFYYDTHADPVPESVFELVADVLGQRPDLPTVLERDANFDDAVTIWSEVDRLRRLARVGRPRRPNAAVRTPRCPAPEERSDDLASVAAIEQIALAHQLTNANPTTPLATTPGVARARKILARKRSERVSAR